VAWGAASRGPLALIPIFSGGTQPVAPMRWLHAAVTYTQPLVYKSTRLHVSSLSAKAPDVIISSPIARTAAWRQANALRTQGVARGAGMRSVLLTGAGLRLVLLLAGLWQDAHSRVRYTDIDYDVFSDAAAAIAAGGSPVCAAVPYGELTSCKSDLPDLSET
jgi:hypothetical protein